MSLPRHPHPRRCAAAARGRLPHLRHPFDYNVLLDTETTCAHHGGKPFTKEMRYAELHYLLGKYLAAREKELGVEDTCVLTAAYRRRRPLLRELAGDSSIGMNIAELAMRGIGPRVDVSRDVTRRRASSTRPSRGAARAAS